MLARPMISSEHKPVIKKIESPDMRDSAWRALGRWMTEKDWYSVLNTESCEVKFRLLMMEITSAIDSFLPRKVVKKHTTDRPWVSKKLKSSKDNLHFSDMEGTLRITNFGGTRSRARSKNSSKWWRQVKSLHAKTLSRSDTINFLGIP